MTLREMKDLCMFQFNQDTEDAADFAPFLATYINEGYDRFIQAWANGRHCGGTDYPFLVGDDDVPKLPERYHKPLCDWATWCLYRNGNSQKQQRGYEYRNSFETALNEILNAGGADGDTSGDMDGDGLDDTTGGPVPTQPYRQFYNIPR